jgi:hypothetical protein
MPSTNGTRGSIAKDAGGAEGDIFILPSSPFGPLCWVILAADVQFK